MKAIVYTSNTGHTAQYAKLISVATGLPAYDLSEAAGKLEKDTQVIYLGWLFAGVVKGYKRACKNYSVRCLCAVGLCDTGTALDQVRKTNALAPDLPLFTVQGGMDKNKLRGINRFMIKMLTKSMDSKKNKTQDDERMLYLLHNDQNYVCEENLAAFMQWYKNETAAQ